MALAACGDPRKICFRRLRGDALPANCLRVRLCWQRNFIIRGFRQDGRRQRVTGSRLERSGKLQHLTLLQSCVDPALRPPGFCAPRRHPCHRSGKAGDRHAVADPPLGMADHLACDQGDCPFASGHGFGPDGHRRQRRATTAEAGQGAGQTRETSQNAPQRPELDTASHRPARARDVLASKRTPVKTGAHRCAPVSAYGLNL